MKKVGVIGAGIAGLTCAYRLSKANIKTIIFEKESIIGGRAPFCGAVASKKFQKRLVDLIEELNLEALKIPLLPFEIGFLADNLIGLEAMPEMMKSFSLKEGDYIAKLNQFVNSVRFDAQSPDPMLVGLREISMEDYFQGVYPKIKAMLIEPMLVFAFENDFSKLSADYGLSHLRFGNELGSGEAFSFEENTVATITNVLEAKVREQNSEIFLSTEVNKVEKKKNSFLITFKEKEQEEVDQVVFALPLFITKKIFPEINLESNVECRNSKCVFIEGKPKYDRKFVIGMPGNPYNIRAWFNVVSYQQYLYPIDEKKAIDYSALYESYKIIGEKELAPATPVVPPKAHIPELKTYIEGAYLCGDFYYYPWLETAVTTAEIVAEMIIKNE